jgi:hypothetical protein
MPLPPALRPLAALAIRYPHLEGQVVWLEDAEFTFQEADELGLDPEEIAFYAEGLLIEGFYLSWALLADVDAPAEPLILQLTCAQDASPPAPPLPDGWCPALIAGGSGRAAP